jgi:hypothetical protein
VAIDRVKITLVRQVKMYPNGIPDGEKLGFIQLNAIGRGGDFTEEIAQLCEVLNRQSEFVDAAGFTNEITAATIDPERQRYAWVECKSKSLESGYVDVNFYLYVMVSTQIVVEWEIETYNPYFGCQVELLHWLPEHLIIIYHEKHDNFICSFDVRPIAPAKPPISKPIARHKIADEWTIGSDAVIFKSAAVDKVDRMALPKLKLLKSWSADYARSIGALPPGYDERNEI